MCALNWKIYTIVVYSNNNSFINVVQEYDPLNDKWTRKKDLPFVRAWSSVCIIGNKIYMFGGANGMGGSADTMEYDPEKDEWTKKADMPEKGAFFPKSAPIIDGKVYVIGGYQAGVAIADVQIYDPQKDEWTKGPDMPTARYGSAVVAYKDKIFVFGGATGADFAKNQLPTPKVEEYDVNGGNPPKSVSAEGKSATQWGSIKAKF